MRVVRKNPGRAPEILEIGEELEDLQQAVGGHLEHFGFLPGIGILCDEMSRLKGPVVNGKPTSLPYNFAVDEYVDFVGPVLFVGESGERFIGLSGDQVKKILGFFEECSADAAGDII